MQPQMHDFTAMGRKGGLAAHASGAQPRAIAEAFRQRALALDPNLSEQDAIRFGLLLRRQNLVEAGRKGAEAKWNNYRAAQAAN
jgi:hypothetical protein